MAYLLYIHNTCKFTACDSDRYETFLFRLKDFTFVNQPYVMKNEVEKFIYFIARQIQIIGTNCLPYSIENKAYNYEISFYNENELEYCYENIENFIVFQAKTHFLIQIRPVKVIMTKTQGGNFLETFLIEIVPIQIKVRRARKLVIFNSNLKFFTRNSELDPALRFCIYFLHTRSGKQGWTHERKKKSRSIIGLH